MKVTVIDREAMRKNWGTAFYSLITRDIEISENCDKCGEKRGIPKFQRLSEDGETAYVSIWNNPCGHVDKYADLLKEKI